MTAPNEPLKACLKALTPDERELFATACDTTIGHLRNVAGGIKSCSPGLARMIQRASGGSVAPWHSRPEDWHRIWPELIGTEGAPPVPTTEQSAELVKVGVEAG